ncbi:unnamed protein product [Lampetra planeri]
MLITPRLPGGFMSSQRNEQLIETLPAQRSNLRARIADSAHGEGCGEGGRDRECKNEEEKRKGRLVEQCEQLDAGDHGRLEPVRNGPRP